MGTDGIGEGARFSGEGVGSSAAANSVDAGGLTAIGAEWPRGDLRGSSETAAMDIKTMFEEEARLQRLKWLQLQEHGVGKDASEVPARKQRL
jgi:hypothetical protein